MGEMPRALTAIVDVFSYVDRLGWFSTAVFFRSVQNTIGPNYHN